MRPFGASATAESPSPAQLRWQKHRRALIKKCVLFVFTEIHSLELEGLCLATSGARRSSAHELDAAGLVAPVRGIEVDRAVLYGLQVAHNHHAQHHNVIVGRSIPFLVPDLWDRKHHGIRRCYAIPKHHGIRRCYAIPANTRILRL